MKARSTCAVLISAWAFASAEELPELVVLSARLEADAPGLLAAWTREDISKEGPRTIDELLAEEPSFSLYRRQTAMFGNPTSAGVSLRNTGASAASRTLVLLDGVPQNDPFGGWVYWAKFDPSRLESVRIVPSARSVVWGNQSPAGVIQMASADAFREGGLLRVTGGSHETYGGSVAWTEAIGKEAAVSVSAFHLHSGGFFGIAENLRGEVDRRLDLELSGVDIKAAWRPWDDITIEPTISWYEEERGNGTPYTGNSTEALDFSLRVTGGNDDFGWQATAYHQRRDFSSRFSSVNADRSAETPSLDQYDVPATGTGGALTFRWKPDEHWTVTSGADVRHVEGATHENATFTGGRFTRRREAGGEQAFAGIFGSAEWKPVSETTVSASARADVWWLYDGYRSERSLVNGTVFRDDRQEDRDGFEPSFALSVDHAFDEQISVFASAGTSFRLPTLNELHRPFRVRNDIVEANAGLDPERFFSVEGGVEWKPVDEVRVRASLFHHWIKDAIANVPVTDPAEIAAIFGTIPPGGSGSQRRNVDEARVLGAQAEIEWAVHEKVTLRLDGIWTETKFTESGDQPLLEGKPFPQAPDLRISAAVEWKPVDAVTLSAGWEYGASQFDDALAARRIGDYTTTKLGVSWRLNEAMSWHCRIENLFDEEIGTGLASDGTRSVAGPRAFWTGMEWSF